MRAPLGPRLLRSQPGRTTVAIVAGLFVLAASLSWSARQLDREIAPRTGWRQTFFTTTDFAGPPALDRRVHVIDLSVIDTEPGLPRGNFSIRWEGVWDLTTDGPVDVYGGGDDELYIHVNDERVLERSPAAGMGTVAQRWSLPAGLHRVRIEHVQYGGGAYANVLWARAGEDPRPFSVREIFPDEPDRQTLFTARLAATRDRVAAIVWRVALALFVLLVLLPMAARGWTTWEVSGRLTALSRAVRSHVASSSQQYARAARIGGLLAVSGILVRTVAARWPALDPESLWMDDLVWGAIVRAPDIGMMLSVPAHAPPGFFLALRGAYALFRDPEWSLQLLPFVSGIAAIPVLALAAWRLTRSAGLAVLAAALVALNPLAAHYSVYVKPYALDLLVTALLLAAGAALLTGSVGGRRVWRAGILSGLGAFLSITSVFVSVPLMTLAAWRQWRTDRDRAGLPRRSRGAADAGAAGAYYALVLLAYLAVRTRTNPLLRADFQNGFLPMDSVASVWAFLATGGRRVLETSLPSWKPTDFLNPETVSWPLPLVGLGLVWLLARRATRSMGLLAAGAYSAAVVASGLHMYPLGTGRADIYAFPIAIVLFTMGVHAATSWIPGREVARAAVGMSAALVALAAPLAPSYFGVNDARLVQRVAAHIRPDDALIVSPSGGYLVSFYGPWPIVVSATTERTNATDATIVRPHTLHLPPDEVRPDAAVDGFLRGMRPARVWYVAFRTAWEAETIDAINRHGYALEKVEDTTRGALYRGVPAPN